jgi:hypothetical protein
MGGPVERDVAKLCDALRIVDSFFGKYSRYDMPN